MEYIQLALLLVVIYLLIAKTEKLSKISLFGSKHKIIVDSCGLIDGRIIEIVKAGFIVQEMVIPQFIVNELQLLADGQDAHKRERARFGLDVIHELQQMTDQLTLTIDRTPLLNMKANDDKLIALSKQKKADLYTTDYNLGKVAAVEGIKVLNINELAQKLRPVNLPGEDLTIKIVQRGSSPDQGVGYLEDGTMVVVDNASGAIGRKLEIEVDRMHQTVAGKMVFAHAVKQQELPKKNTSQSNNRETTNIRDRMSRHPRHG
ncbi:MAG TPA: TRAM domain-containing protein [Patescibacteria group bacterium]|jgi:uncharacterized protein YacL|nr:TRAM domain-containing protein [Patescibacteria group bacterium]